jgi:hypothetical protein
MSPTKAILDMAPAIIRTYAVSFLLLPFNIFSTYYFQAITECLVMIYAVCAMKKHTERLNF